ncbi:glucokinase [Solidesulfovibrio sp.]|uniref:glucokinase n=1 Tax=Solidesulfovibrio sp. TaxID=2910990 RepID=UPI002B2206BA|nr:glucokinase [Solidesulfovibrio sp.]MEA4856953.1 glucokinase [Solidesulfovibrio sp.]
MGEAGTRAIRHVLAVDIGGTSSRFGHFTADAAGRVRPVATVCLPTRGAASFEELLAQLPGAGFDLDPRRADAAVFAVPGAVVGRRVHFANIDWALDLDRLAEAFGLTRSACVNDFLAQAHGCLLLGEAAEPVLPGVMDATLVRAVVGAGTGLGHAALVPLAGGGVLALPSEAGQAAFSFTGPEETAYGDYLCRRTGEGYARADSVVSGSGLAHLHRFLTGEDRDAADIGAALTPDSPTAALFARFYGRAVRQYVLGLVAAGGVYISGGVAAKNPLLVAHPEFARELHDSPTYGHLLRTIPVRLVRDERAGLFGAARLARDLLADHS